MFRRVLAGVAGALMALTAVIPASAGPAPAPVQAAAQVLNWTADNDITRYKSAPTSAVAGATTIVFENSEATGNTTGMSHTLTFDTETPGYNHDVNVNILANPFDAENGKHQVDVVLTPGKYRYFCTIPGHSGMVGEFTVSGGTDTTPPAVTADVTGTKDTNGNYIGSATVTVNASDSESGVDFIEYQVDDTSFQRYTAPVQVTALGDHAVQYRATDKAGNLSPVGSVQFRVVEPPSDTTPPTVTADVAGTKDTNGNYINKATVTITATDNESGVKSTEYKLDSGAWTAYTTPVDVTAAGSHMIHYRATDNANNVSPEGMVSFTVVAADTTPPTVTSSVAGDTDPNGNYISKATVTITATDAGSGVKSTEYKLDSGAWTAYTAPVEVTSAGSHMVHYRATDNANNISPEGMVGFTVVAADTTPPTVAGTVAGDRDNNGNYLGTATVTITATDSGSGVKSREYKLDSGEWTAYTAPVVVNTLGAHVVTYRATDNADNVSPEGTVNFTIVAPPSDTTPPTVTHTVAGNRDQDGNYIQTATVTITATDTQSGVGTTEYKLDSGAWTAYTAPIVVNTVGAHMVHYRATDNANNTSPEGMASFTIVAPPADTTPPTTSAAVSGTKDPNGNYIDTATVTVTATDSQSGVKLIEYSLDNGAWTQYVGAVRVSALGAHTFKYRASDNAGNTAAEQSVAFTVVEPGSDACPESDTRATVIIDRDDTRVANKDTGNGCTINDLIDEHGDYPSHGAFVRHVELVTDDLVARGLITVREQGTIVRAAARSDIGR